MKRIVNTYLIAMVLIGVSTIYNFGCAPIPKKEDSEMNFRMSLYSSYEKMTTEHLVKLSGGEIEGSLPINEKDWWPYFSSQEHLKTRHMKIGTISFLKELEDFSELKIQNICHLKFPEKDIDILLIPLGGYSYLGENTIKNHVSESVVIKNLTPIEASEIEDVNKFYIIHCHNKTFKQKTKWMLRRSYNYYLSFYCINNSSSPTLSTNWCGKIIEGYKEPDDGTTELVYIEWDPWEFVPQLQLNY